MTRTKTQKVPTILLPQATKCTNPPGHTDTSQPATGKKLLKRQRDREHYQKNREKILEKKRTYRAKNREAKREYAKTHYEANKQAYIDRAAARKREGRALWEEYKDTLSCRKCGESHPATFDFHHVIRGPGIKKVHKLVADGMFKRAAEEVKKCIVLCANCHRKLHWEEAQEKKHAGRAKKRSKKSPANV